MSDRKKNIIEVLNFADSFTLAMDEEIRSDGLPGSYGCFALELDKKPDIDTLSQRITEFSHHFPVSVASLQQMGRRFYWCKRESPPQLFFQHSCPQGINGDDFQQQIIDQIINHKQTRDSITPIEFHLITSATKNTFFIRWIHPFCDARGADIILQYLCTEDAEQRQKIGLPKTSPLVNLQLAKYNWWKKITLFLKAKRYISQLDKSVSIQSFNVEKSGAKKHPRLKYTIKRLTENQTRNILKQAKKEVGLTGISLYYIGCLMRALEQMHPNAEGEAYCTPYAFNLRKKRALSPVTGNHVAALFAHASREMTKDREKLFMHLKQQNTNVIRQQLDYAFLPLMWAGSWLPLEEYGKILRLSNGTDKERSSFWFSDVGKLEIPPQTFPGADINTVFHVCQVTSPPALAFLSCIYKNQLTLSYNFIDPAISYKQVEKLHQLVLIELMG